MCAEWEHKNWTQNFISLLFYGFQRINIYIEPSRKSQLFHILSLLLISSSRNSVCSSAPEILSGRCGEWRRQQRWRCRGKVSKIWRRRDCIFSSSSHASVVSAAGTLLICKFAAVTQARRAHKGRDEDWVRNRNHYYAALWMHKMHVKRRSVSGRKKKLKTFRGPSIIM